MIWCVLAAVVIMLVIDWFIVMGNKPREWKGGKHKK